MAADLWHFLLKVKRVIRHVGMKIGTFIRSYIDQISNCGKINEWEHSRDVY